jgi:hypothetical protein
MMSKSMTTSSESLRSEYLSEWPHCQYSLAVGLRENMWAQQGLRRPRGTFKSSTVPATEIEHIWNRHGHKSEHRSNYASVSRPAHTWKHKFSVKARIAICHYKWKLSLSTKDTSHFDLDALKDISGRNVIGWVEMKLDTDVLPDWCHTLGKELIEGNQ